MKMRGCFLGSLAVLVACGGIAVVDQDAGNDATDLDSQNPLDATADQPQLPDAGDAGSWPQYINEGKDCGLPDVDINCWAAIYTCCNNAVCPGGCLQTAPDAQPYCECAGVNGGCPSSTVCCNDGVASCVPLNGCAQQFAPPYCYSFYDQ